MKETGQTTEKEKSQKNAEMEGKKTLKKNLPSRIKNILKIKSKRRKLYKNMKKKEKVLGIGK